MIKMNKAIFPSILAAIILIAGVFAFAPIENASTVHTAIQENQLNQIVIATSNDLSGTAISATCANNDFIVFYVVTGSDTDTFSINLDSDFIVDQTGTFEATAGDGAGINIAAGVANGAGGSTTSFTGSAAEVDGIFTLVGQSDDTCSLT